MVAKYQDGVEAFDMGAVAVGATVYFGSSESRRQIWEVSQAFRRAHELGMTTILWAYLRNNAFKVDGVDYHADLDQIVGVYARILRTGTVRVSDPVTVDR